MTYNHKEFTQGLINGLMSDDSLAGTMEAIAVCLGNLTDEEGKMIGRINLSEDFTQNMEFCMQIAEMLRNEKRKTK